MAAESAEPDSDVTTSPILVGRDALLALASRRLRETAAGRGQLLLLAGEAGIGKTRLLGSIARRAAQLSFDVLTAAAFPGDSESSGGVLLDLAGELRRSTGLRGQGVGRTLDQRLRDSPAGDGDRHRRHRLLVQDLADAILELEPDRPLLVILEDLHWADALSLEVVGHIASRLASRRTLLIGAYRSDELYAGTPLRDFRSRLLPQRLAEEVRLPRLSRNETATLASAMLGRPVSNPWVTAIHDRSDGIPLHIEELVSAVNGELPDADSLRFPDTLAEAVLVRTRELTPVALDVAAAAAVIGRSFDFDLLLTATDRDPLEVDGCLQQLVAAYLVEAGTDSVHFDFRHALIRDALYDQVPHPRRRQLHARVAEAAMARGYPDAVISAHFDAAGLETPAYLHATAAARAAAGVSAHREALLLFRRALRNLPPGTGPVEHARLLAALADQAAAVDENAAALEAYASARGLWLEAGDPLAAAAIVPQLTAVGHLLGDGLDVRVNRLEESLASIEALPVGPERDKARIELLTGLSAAYMLARRLDESIAYGEQGAALAALADDSAADLNRMATLGSVLCFAGRMGEGWALLETAVSRSVDRLEEAEAARSYRMIGSSASVLVEYDRAEQWLPAGISYAETVDLWNHRSYMAAHLAHVRWARGDNDSARDLAEQALSSGNGGITTRITAEYVLGYVSMSRGHLDAATELLSSALRQGEAMAELQRISPPLWGLAETAGLSGDHETALALCDRGFRLSAEVSDAAYLFPFLLTGTRARLAAGDIVAAEAWIARVAAVLTVRGIPGTLPATDHARGLVHLASGNLDAARESLTAARTAWSDRGRFWEGHWALLDEARTCFRARQHLAGISLCRAAETAGLAAGAQSLVTAAQQLAGQQDVPAWYPLSAREFEVAQLVAAGLTNREIAGRLYLSPKTISAHIEHMLAKLGGSRRAEIAAWTERIK